MASALGGQEIRLATQNTPDLLSDKETRNFWLTWSANSAHVATLQLGHDTEVILKWPIPITFVPTKIKAKMVPGGAHVDIRYATNSIAFERA